MAWLQLIRWKNLLIIFLTQFLAWWCVLMPMQRHLQLPLLLNTTNFLLLSLSTVFIGAAGYVINDYFDIRIDAINKPDKMVLENRIPRRMAILFHSILNFLGVVLAFIVAVQVRHFEWLLLQLLCTVMLWFYSTNFKRQFMTGNVVVALLTAFTIVTLMVYEPELHRFFFASSFLQTPANSKLPNPVWILSVYAYFAFVLTWMREVVKDLEDLRGDAEQHCMTMPIKWGIKRSVRFTQMLGVFAIVPLIIVSISLCFSGWMPLGVYTIAAIILPIIAWIIILPKKSTTKHYHTASTRLKYIMLLGIGSLLLYFFQI